MKSKFFCDIVGTYEGGANRKEILLEFVNAIEKLDDNEELNFSFISTNSIDDVYENVKEFYPYISNTKIKMGSQYAFNKVITNNGICDIDNGKLGQIIKDLKGNDYDNVYYADDSKICGFMVHEMIKKLYPNIHLTVFTPLNGIDGLNEMLKDHVKKKLCKRKLFF